MTLFDVPLWIMLLWLFALGASLGSFLNVCTYRIPHHERLRDQIRGLWSPPSRCPRCGHRLLRRDNIPIFGWLLLGGRCRHCRGRISPRYPLIEVLNGLLFVVVYWYEVPVGWTKTIQDSPLYTGAGVYFGSGLSDIVLLHVRYAYHMALIEALIVATFIDFDLMVIPDGATLPAMGVGVLGGLVFPQIHLVPLWFHDPLFVRSTLGLLPERLAALLAPGGLPSHGLHVPAWLGEHPHLHGLLVSLAGLVVGGGIVWGVRIIGRWVLRREAMGFGDVVLMAMIGSFLGWQPTVAVFFIAPVCALAVVAISWMFRREREIPYGPYLSLGALVVLLAWPTVWPVAERIFQLGVLVPLMAVVAAVLLAGSLELMQLAKHLLGIPLYDEPPTAEEWTAADQLAYLAGENHDPQQGRWPTDRWPGQSSARGTRYEELWKAGRTAGQSPINGRRWL